MRELIDKKWGITCDAAEGTEVPDEKPVEPHGLSRMSEAWDVDAFRIPEFSAGEGASGLSDEVGDVSDQEALNSAVDLYEAEALERPEIPAELARLEEVVQGVNPRYDGFVDNEWSHNCGSCAVAGGLRLTGSDPEAVASAVNIPTVAEMERATGREQVTLSADEIRAWMREQPPGTVTVLGMDYCAGAGHWVNLARTEVGSFVVDAQCDRAWSLERYLAEWGPYVRTWDVGMERARSAQEGAGR